MSKVLLTGGLGYIGSHVAVELIQAGYEAVIIDDLSNSELHVLNRLSELTDKDITFVEGDIRNSRVLKELFTEHQFKGVIHLAAKKAVGESVQLPLLYYDVNVSGLVNLLEVIDSNPIEKLVFSSSCTVYGEPDTLPVTEQTPFGVAASPYGRTKQMCEYILMDTAERSKHQTVSLRYFNPVGAHPSGMIGELPKGVPNNLVPFITQTAIGKRESLSVFGDDYDTPDGTAIRDYIHVVDLAKAHVAALQAKQEDAFSAFNIGTGNGYSVMEVIDAFERASGKQLPYRMEPRRAGDVPVIYGNPSVANEALQWQAAKGIDEMMADSWRWEQNVSEE